MNKSILFISALPVWSLGVGNGAPSYAKTLSGYADNGWKVYLLTNHNCANMENKEKYTIYYAPKFLEKIKKNRIIGFPFRLLDFWWKNHIYFKMASCIIEKNKIDILYSYEVYGVIAAKKLSKRYGIPFVTRFQGTILTYEKDSFIQRLRRYPMHQALRTDADLTIMTDDGTLGDEVLKRLGNKSKKVLFYRNGIDVKAGDYDKLDRNNSLELRKQLNITETDVVFLTVSRLVGWKRLERTLYAFEKALKVNDKIKLVIVGDGDAREFYEKIVTDLQINGKVLFLGAIKQSEVIRFYKMADIFVSMYDLSNVGNPLLEAMIYGKPIITWDVGSTKNLICNKETGILLSKEELVNLDKYMIELSNSKEMCQYLGKNARSYAEKNFWSWNQRIETELTEVLELVERKGKANE